MSRDSNTRKSLGGLHSRIKESRVLMVGAGGIGCELLKNLVMTGFGEIHIVDLDTIDLSNLNRQFLFGMQHIKKSKAMVAKETAGKFNPNVKLEAYHANIKDPDFNVKWFQSFDMVFNALDNLDARRHVNRMCLAADVPLIESGTTGFNGQVQVIKQVGYSYALESKGATNLAREKLNVTTVLTRKLPRAFHEIFGTSEESSPDLDPSENSENSREIANLKREAEELKNIREKMDTPEFAAAIFDKVFRADIDRLRSMEEMWKSRKPPAGLSYGEIQMEARDIDPDTATKDQRVWTLAENFVVFEDSLKRLATRMLEMKQEQGEGEAPPVLTFDKDDEDTLDFVAASANLRSLVFGIEVKSKFDIKQMAGNIIPAIATTNAITAGLCVLQAFKVLRNDLGSTRTVFLSRSAERAFATEKPSPPNPACPACGVARTTIEADILRATLGDLVERVLRDGLGYGEEISVMTTQLLYDVEFDDNLSTPLKELGFGEETFVTVIDDEEEPRVNLEIVVTNTSLPADSDPIVVPGLLDIPKKPFATPIPPPQANGNGTKCNAVKRVLDEVDPQSNGHESKRRKLEVIEDRAAKKCGKLPAPLTEVVVIDDDGIINID